MTDSSTDGKADRQTDRQTGRQALSIVTKLYEDPLFSFVVPSVGPDALFSSLQK